MLMLLASIAGLSQKSESDSIFYFRGRVVDADEMSGLYNVHLINEQFRTGTVSALDGSFRLAASVGDTIRATLVGYRSAYVVVKPEHQQAPVRVLIPMRFDLTNMEPVTIYGKTFEQFREDFRSLRINPKTMNDAVIESIEDDLELLGPVSPTGFTGPIQFLYDRLNKTESLRRRLNNNRKKTDFPLEAYEGFPTHPSDIPDTTNYQL